jgi:hypothetical protein
LGGEALPDNKPSGSLERDDASLKRSGLDDGEPPAKKERLDSENITRKKKHSTGKHPFPYFSHKHVTHSSFIYSRKKKLGGHLILHS